MSNNGSMRRLPSLNESNHLFYIYDAFNRVLTGCDGDETFEAKMNVIIMNIIFGALDPVDYP